MPCGHASKCAALPEQNDRSYHISFDCSWLLQAESDEDRARWLAGVAVIGVRQSNLKVEGPPDEVCCGSLTRYMMDGTGCSYWAVLFDDGWLHLYSSREQQAEQETPKIRLNLRSKHGAATARILSNVTLPTVDGDVTAEPETITGCFAAQWARVLHVRRDARGDGLVDHRHRRRHRDRKSVV